jgi:hypothetical protein
MKTLILTILFGMLAVPVWADEIDKLENAFVTKSNHLKAERDKGMKVIEDKYIKDSQSLAQSYINSLKRIEKSIVKKGDLDGALKVRAKIKEIEAIVGLSKEEPETKEPDNPKVSDVSGNEKALGYKLKRHPIGAKQLNGHYYKYVSGNISLAEAKEKSKKMGGYLATVNSKEEFDFLTKYLGKGKIAWLGGMINGTKHITWYTRESDSPPIDKVNRYHNSNIGPFLVLNGTHGNGNGYTLSGARNSGKNGSGKATVTGFIVEWDY